MEAKLGMLNMLCCTSKADRDWKSVHWLVLQNTSISVKYFLFVEECKTRKESIEMPCFVNSNQRTTMILSIQKDKHQIDTVPTNNTTGITIEGKLERKKIPRTTQRTVRYSTVPAQ